MAEGTEGKTAAEGLIPMAAENKHALLNQEVSTSSKQTNSPPAVQMFLKQISNLTEIPLSVLLERVCIEGILDLSNTNIKSLPSTISNLVELRELLLRDCKLLMELPPKIGALSDLKVLDLEGTKLICLPKEIEGLVQLECLKVSLSKRADYYIKRKGIEGIIPRQTLLKFFKLRELSINVDPDCGWWDAEVEVIIDELPELRNLEILRLYLPTVELLQKFLRLPRNLYKNLSDFKLIVGRHEERIISCLPRDLQDKFEDLEKCLKYVNGEGSVNGIGTALEQASAFLLDRHWTIEKLSAFKNCKMDKLRFCLLVECSEMNTVFDGADFYQDGNKVNGSKQILVWLQCLSIYYMKSLETIWKGPIVSGCLSSLQCLALHTCPRLKIIFKQGLIHNLLSLKELIVADCPQVESLISVEYGNDFLPSLKKISLLHLPEFSSISRGLRIAPFLKRMMVYNCPKLKSLSPPEISSNHVEEIKGESEWWEALEWKSSQRNNLVDVFVPLGRDGHLIDQLAQASVHSSLNNMVHSVSMEKNNYSTTWHSQLESFEKEVFNRFHNLLDATADEFLSLTWILKLLDAFIACQEEFWAIFSYEEAQLLKPPLDGLISNFLNTSVKALDICNAARDGIEKIRAWQKYLDIVLNTLDSQQKIIREGQFRRAGNCLRNLALVMRNGKDSGPILFHNNFSSHRCKPQNSKDFHYWSAANQLQSISNELVPPNATLIVKTNGLANAIFTMSSVVLLVLWTLVAVMPLQDGRVLEIHFPIPQRFSWSTPMYMLQARIIAQSKINKDSIGLLKETYRIEKTVGRISDLVASAQFPMEQEQREHMNEAVEELSLVREACKLGLDPLERQLKQVFNKILTCRTEGLELLDKVKMTPRKLEC